MDPPSGARPSGCVPQACASVEFLWLRQRKASLACATSGYAPPAARRARFEREHPKLHASRFVVKGIGQVALAILGISLLAWLIPAIPWPDTRFRICPTSPSPGWVKAIAESKRYWLPIVIGIVLANAELKRRRKVGDRDPGPGDAARAGEGPPRTG